ncbi:aromatic prenyltransferase [Aspergillus saccharolyticus JOP 1030-1]|uniref:Aromatic prenyltransferase n=1 Tax=Aspergillus saccharolyticus JOP 1030-1 TaxID=1450539 RepID=A0A318ZPH2_9EURO|nr:aromatic prenyltransferase [Aspergillus saccharolyticus JOP 1030-1]PYH48907.1 aromatic prenyltransferase [Aspergillus saccharolyticus JOP 1030-1]
MATLGQPSKPVTLPGSLPLSEPCREEPPHKDTTAPDTQTTQASKHSISDNPWDIIVRYPPHPPDSEELKWWENIAPLMGRLLQVAHYPLSEQYQHLLFLRNQLVPLLGPYPHQYHSLLTVTGHPFEASLNLQGAGAAATVRLTMEPLGRMTGPNRDRFRQVGVAQICAQIAGLGLQGFDLELHRHITAHLTLSGEEERRLTRDDHAFDAVSVQATHCMGFDFLPAGASAVKGYFFLGVRWKLAPAALGATLLQCLEQIPARCHVESLEAMRPAVEYMEAGQHFNDYTFLGWDYTDPAAARVKLYGVCGGNPSLETAEEIWTIGGRLQAEPWCPKGLELLRRLWKYLEEDEETETCSCGRPLASTRDAADQEQRGSHRQICLARKLLALAWNYEVQPGRSTALPKLYLSVHRKNDLFVARALARFFRSLGWEDRARTYVEDLQYVFAHEDLSQSTRVHNIVSLAYTEEKGAYVSMYYHSCLEYGSALVE